jgi:SAM-dependent methyltransferase
MESWHDQDDFWIIAEPILFSWQRREDAPKEINDIISLLGAKAPARILDMGCGIGRHSLELARRGFTVTGVDRTRSYLEKASNQAKEEGLDIEFVQDDMRSFRRPEQFDISLNLYTSFGYFEKREDDGKVVANIHSSLKRGGVLLMDIMGKEVVSRDFKEREWMEEDGWLVLQERKLGQDWGWLENRWIIIKDNDRTELKFSHRLYSAVEIVRLMKDNGFKEVDVFGSLSGIKYDHQAQRLIVKAVKGK